jgi:hypothetical protein
MTDKRIDATQEQAEHEFAKARTPLPKPSDYEESCAVHHVRASGCASNVVAVVVVVAAIVAVVL